MKYDIEEVKVSKYKTPDGKVFDSEEKAKEWIDDLSERKELSKFLVKLNVKIPYLLERKLLNYQFYLLGEVFDLYKINNYADYLKLKKLTLKCLPFSFESEIKNNDFEAPMFLLAGRNHFRKFLPVEKVIKDCLKIEEECNKFLSEKDEFINYLNSLREEN